MKTANVVPFGRINPEGTKPNPHDGWELFRRLRTVSPYNASYLFDCQQVTGDEVLRKKNIRLLIVGHMGIILMVILAILTWDRETQELRVWANFPKMYTIYVLLKFIIAMTTAICLGLVVDYYFTRAKWMVRAGHFESSGRALCHSGLLKGMIVELVTHAIIPLPFAENVEYLGDKLGPVMFARLYVWARFIRDHSAIYKFRREIIHSHPLYRRTYPTLDIYLTLMVFVYEHTFLFIVTGVISLLLVASFCIWIVERDVGIEGNNFTSFGDTFYFSIVTMTTIGYGDIAPQRFWGRTTAMFIGVWGIIVVTMFSSLTVHKLSPSKEQEFSVAFVKEEECEKLIRIEYIRMLQITWRFRHGRMPVERWGRKWLRAEKRIHTLRARAMIYSRTKNQRLEGDRAMAVNDLRIPTPDLETQRTKPKPVDDASSDSSGVSETLELLNPETGETQPLLIPAEYQSPPAEPYGAGGRQATGSSFFGPAKSQELLDLEETIDSLNNQLMKSNNINTALATTTTSTQNPLAPGRQPKANKKDNSHGSEEKWLAEMRKDVQENQIAIGELRSQVTAIDATLTKLMQGLGL
eukprot:TRINITY_DN61101_c0_g1_i1.p1 TRINITY_DN61101_c0_g1~~TRINITY_DN61101_c0_g1_i1.p1  ORF type:complete len:580 (+),score=21.02 TRINITY_DN61101_c0_g1_i1:39-1778(+)